MSEIEILNDNWLVVLEKSKDTMGTSSPKVQSFLKHYMPDLNISLYGSNKEKIITLFKILGRIQNTDQIVPILEEFFKATFGYKNFEDLEKNTNAVQTKIIKKNFEYDYGYSTYQRLLNFEMLKKYVEKVNQSPIHLEKIINSEKKVIQDRAQVLQYKENEKAPDIKIFTTRIKAEFNIKDIYYSIRIPKEQIKILIAKLYTDFKAVCDFLGISYAKFFDGIIIIGQNSKFGPSAFDFTDKVIYLNDVQMQTFIHEWFYYLNYTLGQYLHQTLIKHDVTVPQGYWSNLNKEVVNEALPETKIVALIELLKVNLETYELKFNLRNKLQDYNSELLATTFEIWLSERIGKNLKIVLNNQRLQESNLDKSARGLICHFWDNHWKELNELYSKIVFKKPN